MTKVTIGKMVDGSRNINIDGIDYAIRRFLPLAENHYPDAAVGDIAIHPSGDLSCVMDFPPDCEDDPTAELWWALLPPEFDTQRHSFDLDTLTS